MISSRRLAREWALKILYQLEHITPGSQAVLDALLHDLSNAEQQLGQQAVREVFEAVLTAFKSGQESLEREITQAGYSYLQARDLLQDLSRGSEFAFKSKRPVPTVVAELAQAFHLLEALRAQAEAVSRPLHIHAIHAFLSEARLRLQAHARQVRGRLEQEVADGALERLRQEFVQRGSRAASGSSAEQISLDLFTSYLRDVLPGLNRSLEQALSLVTPRLLKDAPFWQEQRIDRLFREPASALPNSPKRILLRAVAEVFGLSEAEVAGLPALAPPRLLAPLPQSAILPPAGQNTDPLSTLRAQMTAEDLAQLERLIVRAREELPARLEGEFRLAGLMFARDLVHNRPTGLDSGETQAYARAQRETFNHAQVERWRKVGAVVEKQTGEWLRTAAFAVRLVRGVAERQREIDAAIAALSSGWHMDRQVAVDRNILRIGGYEMLFMEGVPTAASINEAVELAKKYSTAESGRFVNGVLGALAVQVGSKLSAATPSTLEVLDNIEPDELIDIDDIDDIDDDLDEEAPDTALPMPEDTP